MKAWFLPFELNTHFPSDHKACHALGLPYVLGQVHPWGVAGQTRP